MDFTFGSVSRRFCRKASGLRVAQGVVATGVTVACAIYLFSNTSVTAFGQRVWQANYLLVFLALVLSFLTIVCKAARWRLFYPSQGRPGLGFSVTTIAAGQVLNWAAPARLGDLLRVGSTSSESSATASMVKIAGQGLGVLVAEKLVDIAFLILAALLLSIGVGLPDWLDAFWLFMLVGSCGLVGMALAVIYRCRVSYLRASGMLDHSSWSSFHFVSGLLQYVLPIGEGALAWLVPQTIFRVMPWSVGAWGLGGLVNYVVLLSLNVNHGLETVLALLVALYGGAVVPSLPGRLGVFQYLCVLALTTFKVDLDAAIAVSLVLYVTVYLPPIVLGSLSVFRVLTFLRV